MNFFSKEWLYIGAAAAIAVLAVYRLASLKRRKLLKQFASARLLPQLAGNFSEAKFFVKRALFLAGVIFVFIAMARPQWGYRWEETKTRGIDIIFAIDTSKSMLAEDVTPNRLERAKLAVMDLVNALKGDKIGIVAFSGQAFLQCPLTLDYDAFRLSLDALDTDIIKRGGTNIAAAIAESEVAFADTSNKKTIVLISDGEELEASALAKAEECAKRGVTIYTLGVGGVKGRQIPIRDARGKLTYVKDEFGNAVTSKLNEEVLEKIAKATGGFYEPLSANGMDLIYEEGLKKIPQHEMSARMKQLAIERFQIPLLIAIILLALEPLIGTRKFFVRAGFGGKAALLALVAALSSAFPEDARADGADGGDAPERKAFNEGVDAYEKRDFVGAKEKFTEAIRLDEELKIHPKSFYNMAASDYRAARDAFAKARPASEFKNLDRRILAQTVQTAQNSAALLREGLDLLKREQDAAKQAEGKGEEAVKAAIQNSPLRDKQFQERLKQGISQCEAAEKSADDAQKSVSENLGAIAAATASLESSIKSLNSALAIDPDYAKAKKNLATAKSAQKNLNSETDILQNALSAFTDQNGDVRASVENLKKIKEELKKLLRDDQNQNQQNQNQQNQQNQDQQNQNQQNQDQNQQQNQSGQNQSQEQQQDRQNQNQAQQQNQQQNQQDRQQQDQQSQQDKEQNKDGQKTDSEKGKDNQKQDASKGSDNREQKSDADSRQNDNGDQNKDEQAADTGAPRDEKNADNSKDEKARQGEEGRERREEQAAPADNRQLRQAEAGTEDKDGKAGENYRKAAGAMSRAEARQLLDALKADEKSLPHSGFGEQRRRYEEKTYKDW
ncbi:MAG: hypothetical protein DBX55_06390 [Verrucomicrobia bacterium]|nr:MAG: hypothetical protein DBX55_06390 [Verrucomicrobiota bacterium]